jgi:hypothetical protein
VDHQTYQNTNAEEQSKKKVEEMSYKRVVVIPYVQGLSKIISRTMKQCGITTALKPYKTIQNYLVRPKDNLLTYLQVPQYWCRSICKGKRELVTLHPLHEMVSCRMLWRRRKI